MIKQVFATLQYNSNRRSQMITTTNLPQEIADIVLAFIEDCPTFYQLDLRRSKINRFVVISDYDESNYRIQIKELGASCIIHWSTGKFLSRSQLTVVLPFTTNSLSMFMYPQYSMHITSTNRLRMYRQIAGYYESSEGPYQLIGIIVAAVSTPNSTKHVIKNKIDNHSVDKTIAK